MVTVESVQILKNVDSKEHQDGNSGKDQDGDSEERLDGDSRESQDDDSPECQTVLILIQLWMLVIHQSLVTFFEPIMFYYTNIPISPWWTLKARVFIQKSMLRQEREREMFYLTTHSTHFIYGYMASDIWLRTILIVRKETHCRHIGYSYRLTARFLLYAPSHRQDNTYHGLCYTSRGALAGMRNTSMGPPHEGSIRRPTAPWANALPLSYVPLHAETKVIIMLRKFCFVIFFSTRKPKCTRRLNPLLTSDTDTLTRPGCTDQNPRSVWLWKKRWQTAPSLETTYSSLLK